MKNLFWEDFDKQSNSLKGTFIRENALNEDERGQVIQLIKQIFLDINQMKTNYYDGLRVFDAGNGIRLDLNERLLKHKKNKIDDLDLFFKEVMEVDKYLVAFKEITKLNDGLENILQEYLIRPFIQKFGIPLGGFEAYMFIGNYGFTPFGIHQDNEESLLLNLGPYSKDVWIWNNKVDPKIKFDPSFLKSAEIQFSMKSGTFCHIPSHIYHILSSDEFSIMIGIIPQPLRLNFFNIDVFRNVRFEEKILTQELQKIINEKYGDLLGRKFSKTFSELYIKLLKSNGYCKDAPIHLGVKETDVKRDYHSYGNLIILNKTSDILQIACRNQVITFPNCASIRKLIIKLNKNKKIRVSNLIEELSIELEQDLVNFVIDTLIKKKAIF